MVSSDRGQVLLLGGLAIAIVFLTAIPLSNSLVVTESASSSDAVDDIERAENREASAERGLRTVMAGVNTSNATAVNESLRAFSAYYTNVSGQQDGVYVNTSLNVTESTGGEISSNSGGRFQNPTGGPNNNDWRLIDDASLVSELWVRVESISGDTTNAFTVNVSNDTGFQWRIRVYDDSGTTIVETRDTSTGSWQEVCRGPRPVELNVTDGTCTPDADSPTATPTDFQTYTDTVDSPSKVRFQKGNRGRGDYRLAGKGDFPNGDDPAVVIAAVDLTFVGPQGSYTKTIRVDDSP